MRLLIVDDEINTVRGLTEFIPWQEYGIHEIRTALNGETALEIAKEFEPQIVLTDVSMPKMNGIELTQKLSGILPNTKVIFVSGYWEKEYLKNAFKNGVLDYILKPVDIDELGAAVSKAVDAIRKEQQQTEYISKLHFGIASIMPSARDRLFLALTQGWLTDSNYFKESLEITQTEFFLEGFYCTACLRIGNRTDGQMKPSREADEADILQICNQYIQKSAYTGWCFHSRDNVYTCVLSLDKVPVDGLQCETKRFCSVLADQLRSRYHLCTIGIGRWVEHIMDIWRSYCTAEECLQRGFVIGINRVIDETDVYGALYTEENGTIEELFNTLRNISTAKSEDIPPLVDTAFQVMRHCGKHQASFYQVMATNILYAMLDSMRRNEPSQIGYEERIDKCVLALAATDDIQSLQQIIHEEYEFRQQEAASSGKAEHPIITMAKAVMHTAFDEDISVKAIADQVFISASYLAALFKKETGLTVNEYLTSIRLQKATEMLIETDKRVIDISLDVGYRDSRYFSRLFKDMFGILPTEYRKQNVQKKMRGKHNEK